MTLCIIIYFNLNFIFNLFTFSDGQKVAARLAKQQLAVATSLRKHLRQCNIISQGFYEALEFENVKHSNAEAYIENVTDQVG